MKVARDLFDREVRPLLEAARRRTRPRIHDHYDVFSAIVYLFDSDSTWRALPDSFPPWRSVHQCFLEWTSSSAPTLLERAFIAAGRSDLIPFLHTRLIHEPKENRA